MGEDTHENADVAHMQRHAHAETKPILLPNPPHVMCRVSVSEITVQGLIVLILEQRSHIK